jgi:2-amino-4-hydroxy-6-hydroxymethyldihydropteridine diphosphokinase
MLRQDYMTWQAGDFEIALNRPQIMGIVNVTPDSFSDGGAHAEPKAAIEYAMKLLDDGADIIDVGGESTRPGFTPVDEDEEARRVVPVVRALVDEGAIVSIDTRHAAVAKMCVRLGASIVNDVTGFTDPAMVDVATSTNCGVVVMHYGEVSDHTTRKEVLLDTDPRAKGAELSDVMKRAGSVTGAARPARAGQRQFTLPDSAPIMRHIMGFLGDQARLLQRAGVAHDRICLDPGAGFGKLADEDVVIQRATAKMVSMGYPLMCAVSRKRFVGAISGVGEAKARDAATIGVSLAAAEAGARILRVHDVAGISQALNAYWSCAHPLARRAFVALGSNVGDRLGYLSRAVALINEIPLTAVTSVSHAYESDGAYGISSTVANAVVEIKTELAPEVLLGHLVDVEDMLERVREEGQDGHGDRTIDCDLVFMEDERSASSRLRLPHPGLAERDFVLVPMEDLMPNPERYLRHAGIDVLERAERVGIVRSDLGELTWQ